MPAKRSSVARKSNGRKRTAAASTARTVQAFDAGKNVRRLRAIPSNSRQMNALIRQYGATVVARSRYLCNNNPYASNAKESFCGSLVGNGIRPSFLVTDEDEKRALTSAFADWADVADDAEQTDFYGLQTQVAAELFEAGECFVRFLVRLNLRPLAPLQLQLLPMEMLPLAKNEKLANGNKIVMGIEFSAEGKRVAYHFHKQHPGADSAFLSSEYERVEAHHILHLFKPRVVGQIRGIPHTLAGITRLAIMDLYEDAELERKRTAALHAVFIERDAIDDSDHALSGGGTTDNRDNAGQAEPDGGLEIQPGAAITLLPGEKANPSLPADVGGNFEAFEYRMLSSIAAGMGVPYADMTGDLRQTSYGSLRGGQVEYRRRISQIQRNVMIWQLCRRVRNRWMNDSVLAGAIPITALELETRADLRRADWITPAWPWVDPLKDRQAERIAVEEGWKSRSDVMIAEGLDPVETDGRIAADQERVEKLDLKLGPKKLAAAELPGDPEPPPPAPPPAPEE